eukprot:1149192-Pelagomonas_calceolata.AAC.2
MHESNSESLRRALKADQNLADRDESCWGFKVQTAEGVEESGCPQSPKDELKNSNLPSLVRKANEANGIHSL